MLLHVAVAFLFKLLKLECKQVLLDLDLPQIDLLHESDSQEAVNWVERAF